LELEWNEEKRQWNVTNRQLDFAEVENFGWRGAAVYEDRRTDYGERRFLAYGHLGERLHVLCFVEREDRIRVISFRKANKRERARYGDEAKR
jgi:uncharacterized DUF497 family protein